MFKIIVIATVAVIAAGRPQEGHGHDHGHAYSSQSIVLHQAQTHEHQQAHHHGHQSAHHHGHQPAQYHGHQAAQYHGEHHEEHYTHPKYEFEYKVSDPHTGDNKYQRESRDGDLVKGEYSLHEADGTVRVVHYTADKHSGFIANVKHEGHAKHIVPEQNYQGHHH